MKRPAKRPAAAISSKRPACVQPPAEQVRDLSGFPEPNDWASLLPQVSVHRPLVVSMPCVGIDACGYALESMGVSYSAVNVYDLESRYEAHLRSHLGASCELHLGQVEGDLTQHLCSRGLPCDLLVSGPPCPPWAGNGNKGGAEDARADVFVSVLKYCVHMATMGSLHAVVLENVHGILEKTQKGKAPSFMDAVLEALRMAVPQFDWQVAVLRAQDFRLPQKRTRVFLRGLRRCFGEVPAPLAPMGELPLEAFLKPNLPPVNRASVTACIRRNLKDAERELLQKWDSGELSAKDIICFPADRAIERKDIHPCLPEEHGPDPDHLGHVPVLGVGWLPAQARQQKAVLQVLGFHGEVDPPRIQERRAGKQPGLPAQEGERKCIPCSACGRSACANAAAAVPARAAKRVGPRSGQVLCESCLGCLQVRGGPRFQKHSCMQP